jgi:tetratricopeptide (TPR) repeat protein
VSAIKRWFFVELARWCKVFGQGDTALKFYELGLREKPDDPVVMASIGFELAGQGRKREALAWFDRAVAARPDYAEGHFDRGFLLQELNDPEAAIAAFDKALASNPDHDRALYGRALSLIGLRRLDEAVAPLEKNTKLQPFSPYGWYQLGRVQYDRGKPEKTQAIIDHLATFEPKVAAQLARETGLTPPAP